MRTRSIGLSLLASLAIIVSACGNAASPSPTTAPPVGSAPAATGPAATAVTSALKIGVVTDIGTLNDKNFNQYSYQGAVQGALDIGAPAPKSVVPKDQSEYAKDIQDFVDQKFDIIVTVGFNLTSATTKAAKANPNTWFIGVDQTPCVDETGADDATFACKGAAATLLPKYVSITFKEDQAGYLAGIVAAGVSKSGTIGAIGGTTLCAPCVRYIQGYELGAKSVNANIVVKTAYVTRDFSAAAFSDQPGGKVFATNFLTTNPTVDVIFQVAGLTGNGIVDAACAKKIYAVGVDVDQFLSYPDGHDCLITSAEKHLLSAVDQTIKAIAAGTAKGGNSGFDATNNGIGVSQGHNLGNVWAAGTQALLDTALAAMKAGTLVTCPADSCGVGPK